MVTRIESDCTYNGSTSASVQVGYDLSCTGDGWQRIKAIHGMTS